MCKPGKPTTANVTVEKKKELFHRSCQLAQLASQGFVVSYYYHYTNTIWQ